MKIIVSSGKRRIVLHLPLWLFKSKRFIKPALKYINSARDNKETIESKELKEIYKILKKFIKENGHFDLVKIETKDDYILIRV